MSVLAHPGTPFVAPTRRRHLTLVPEAPAIEVDQLAEVIPFPVRASQPVVATPRVARRPAAEPVATAGAVRLTVRGRRVVAALVLAVASVIGAAVGLAVSGADAAPQQVETVTVASGESLWSLAVATAGPGDDVREVMAQIVELNDLGGSDLAAGQVLTVPVGD